MGPDDGNSGCEPENVVQVLGWSRSGAPIQITYRLVPNPREREGFGRPTWPHPIRQPDRPTRAGPCPPVAATAVFCDSGRAEGGGAIGVEGGGAPRVAFPACTGAMVAHEGSNPRRTPSFREGRRGIPWIMPPPIMTQAMVPDDFFPGRKPRTFRMTGGGRMSRGEAPRFAERIEAAEPLRTQGFQAPV